MKEQNPSLAATVLPLEVAVAVTATTVVQIEVTVVLLPLDRAAVAPVASTASLVAEMKCLELLQLLMHCLRVDLPLASRREGHWRLARVGASGYFGQRAVGSDAVCEFDCEEHFDSLRSLCPTVADVEA